LIVVRPAALGLAGGATPRPAFAGLECGLNVERMTLDGERNSGWGPQFNGIADPAVRVGRQALEAAVAFAAAAVELVRRRAVLVVHPHS
jgi:hypothetical protein